MYHLHTLIHLQTLRFLFRYEIQNGATAGLSLTLDPMGKIFQNASSLKPLGQLKPNYPGMIIGRSSTKRVFYMPVGNPRWPSPQYSRHNFGRVPSKNHFSKIWLILAQQFPRRRFFFKFHPPFFLMCIIGQNRQKFKVHQKSCHTC